MPCKSVLVKKLHKKSNDQAALLNYPIFVDIQNIMD